MPWLERSVFAFGGMLVASLFFWRAGKLTISGDFAANAGGAAIGGLISVGLALAMFSHERKVAAKDAFENARRQRDADIQQALRRVRGIRESIEGARVISIRTCARITVSINEAVDRAIRALEDHELTDVPLRFAMEDAAEIGRDAAERLRRTVYSSGLQDANATVSAASIICDTANQKIDNLISEYTSLRAHPNAS